MLAELQHLLTEKLKKQTLPARILLNQFRFPNDEMRLKPQYQDNSMPFWYYLGLEVRPKSILDVGSDLGLEAACVILGSKTRPVVSLYNTKSRFTQSNIKLVGADIKIGMENNDWELGIVNGKFCDLLPSIWEKTKLGSLLCVTDAKSVLEEFAKFKNRVPTFFELRHNIGLLQK